MEEKKNTARKGFLLSAFSLILALLLILINIALLFVPSRILDMDITASKRTASKRYTLSEDTKKLISELEEDITLYVLNADGSDKGLEAFIKRYDEASKHINIEYINTSVQPDFLTSLGYQASSEVAAYTIIVKGEKRSSPINSSELYVYYNELFGEISASDYSYYLQYFASSEAYSEYYNELAYNTEVYLQAEALISLGIDYVSQEFIPHAYFITGRGEDSATSGNFATFLSEYGYKVEAHDIKSSKGIPEDAGCIVINSPSEDYTEAEAKVILDYLKNGGRMLLLTDVENVSMKNLMSIMEYYGATAQSVLISEDKEQSEGEDGSDKEKDPHEIETVLNTSHDVFAFAEGYEESISILNATPITVKPESELRDSQLVSAILSTKDKTYTESAEQKGAYTVGVAVEEIADNGTTGIVWLTGADAFNGGEADTEALALPFFSFYWVNVEFSSEFLSMSGAAMSDGMLVASASIMMWSGVVMILLIPAAFIGVGARVYLKRRKA